MLLLLVPGCTLLNREGQEAHPPPNGDRLPEPRIQTRETVFYLPDGNWRVLVPVRIHIPWEEGIARATIGYLTEGNTPQQALDAGLMPLLPAGTEVLGVTIRDGLARVDLSRNFLSYTPENERLVIYGLIYTLTEFPTITKVELLVEGQKPELPGMMPSAVDYSRAFGVNLEVAEGLDDDFANTEQITLFYLLPSADSVFYVPVTRVVPKTEDRVWAVVDELLKGPAWQDVLLTAIPRSITLDSVSVQGTKATLRLSGDLASAGGGQLAADYIRQQLALTLTEIPGIMEVEVLVDGEHPRFGPGIQFPDTFGRPKLWNLVDGIQ